MTFYIFHFQTQTQAERKIVEAKREALLKEASENVLTYSSLQGHLAALDSIKPHPYGTFLAVNIIWSSLFFTFRDFIFMLFLSSTIISFLLVGEHLYFSVPCLIMFLDYIRHGFCNQIAYNFMNEVFHMLRVVFHM